MALAGGYLVQSEEPFEGVTGDGTAMHSDGLYIIYMCLQNANACCILINCSSLLTRRTELRTSQMRLWLPPTFVPLKDRSSQTKWCCFVFPLFGSPLWFLACKNPSKTIWTIALVEFGAGTGLWDCIEPLLAGLWRGPRACEESLPNHGREPWELKRLHFGSLHQGFLMVKQKMYAWSKNTKYPSGVPEWN